MSFRFRPAVESMDQRIVPTCVVSSAQVNGFTQVSVLGDQSADVVRINDFGNGVVQVSATGAGTTVFANVNAITVNTGGGDDDVGYDLLGSLLANRSETVIVGLGSNNDPSNLHDTYHAFLHPGITLQEGSLLSLIGMGGAGNDNLSMSANYVNVAPTARLKSQFGGGKGDDTVTQVYFGGTNDGAVTLRTYGDEGADTVVTWMQFAGNSTGVATGLVYGGNPNIRDGEKDTVALVMIAPSTMASVAGDLWASTQDTIFNTSNVTVHM